MRQLAELQLEQARLHPGQSSTEIKLNALTKFVVSYRLNQQSSLGLFQFLPYKGSFVGSKSIKVLVSGTKVVSERVSTGIVIITCWADTQLNDKKICQLAGADSLKRARIQQYLRGYKQDLTFTVTFTQQFIQFKRNQLQLSRQPSLGKQSQRLSSASLQIKRQISSNIQSPRFYDSVKRSIDSPIRPLQSLVSQSNRMRQANSKANIYQQSSSIKMSESGSRKRTPIFKKRQDQKRQISPVSFQNIKPFRQQLPLQQYAPPGLVRISPRLNIQQQSVKRPAQMSHSLSIRSLQNKDEKQVSLGQSRQGLASPIRMPAQFKQSASSHGQQINLDRFMSYAAGPQPVVRDSQVKHWQSSTPVVTPTMQGEMYPQSIQPGSGLTSQRLVAAQSSSVASPIFSLKSPASPQSRSRFTQVPFQNNLKYINPSTKDRVTPALPVPPAPPTPQFIAKGKQEFKIPQHFDEGVNNKGASVDQIAKLEAMLQTVKQPVQEIQILIRLNQLYQEKALTKFDQTQMTEEQRNAQYMLLFCLAAVAMMMGNLFS